MNTPLTDFRIVILSFDSELEFMKFQEEEMNEGVEITSFRQDFRNCWYCQTVLKVPKGHQLFTEKLESLEDQKRKKEQHEKDHPEDLPF